MRLLGWLLVLCVGAAGAATTPVPSALQDWQSWVLHGQEQQTCALLTSPAGDADAGHQCVWPTHLALDADKAGGHFQLGVHVGAESWVALPGDHDAWPQQVQVDGKAAVVLDRNGVPTLRLGAGDYTVQGDLPWDARPPRLHLPASIALVDLKVDGAVIAQPERNGDWITLGQGSAHQREADALAVRVFRKLSDGMPPLLATQIQLHVAGSAREQLLGPALPEGFIATSLAGDLPARLDPDGRLRVQLRPGDWTLTLAARGTVTLATTHFKVPPAPWPKQEVWSYADAPALRATRVAGVPSIDPGQANVPQDWRDLPAYVLADGATFTVEQRARGLAGNADRLKLSRALWLDFDGKGISADDQLTGSLRDSDRLDVAAPWQLLHARDASADAPLLVTRGKADTTGVEVRTQAIDLRTGLREAGYGGVQSATGGWQQTFDDVDATLHLPYGYRLLAAPGADHSPDSWIARWNLLDLFVAAVIALLVWKLLGWRWALVALGFVVLSHGEPGAPRWTPALVVVFALVATVLPDGKLRKVARWSGVALFALAVIVSLPFAAVQVRDALHPQLESTGMAWITPQPANGVAVAQTEFIPPPPADIAPAAAPPPPAPPPPQEQVVMSSPAAPAPRVAAQAKAVVSGQPQSLQTVVVTGLAMSASSLTPGFPAGTVLQSGRGVPDWTSFGSSYRLGWSGPVTASQTWRMLILPAWATRILRIVMLALLVAWLAVLARALGLRTRWPRAGARGATGVAALMLVLAFASTPARADSTPSPQLLAQLQARLLEAPQCAPQCAATPMAQVSVGDSGLQVVIEADAATHVGFPLPRMDAPATLASVTLDGKSATQLVRRDGTLWIALDRGVHRVLMQFTFAADAGSAALHFPLPPPVVQVSAPAWQVAGIGGGKLLSDTLAFTRIRQAANASGTTGAAPAQAFPPYVTVMRNVMIGVDSTVQGVATRVSPASGGFTVEVPLLAGEHVSTPGMQVEGGKLRVTFAPDQDQVQWAATLDATPALKLVAPPLGERAEVWRVSSTALLHLAFAGVPESSPEDTDDASGVHVFRPLPGEALEVAITRPVAVPGDTVAFDKVTLLASRGDHALESTLTLATRSTRGGEQVIQLPRNASLLDVSRNGQPLQLNLHDGRLGLPVQPGAQTFNVRFRDASPLGVVARTPVVSIDAPLANIRTSLSLPRDRWVLWTWGPQAGPAVLIWSQLIVLLVIAIALAKFAPTPLRWWHWLLLGMGFAAFARIAFVVVAAWLIVVGLRARSERYVALARLPFNALQILLAGFTVIAVLCLIAAVPYGLLGHPNMRVEGMGSSAWLLHWFTDQGRGALPRGGAFSLPLWAYKLAMLLWALWLANALVGWLRWAFDAWMRGGYWKSPPKAAAAAVVAKQEPPDARG